MRSKIAVGLRPPKAHFSQTQAMSRASAGTLFNTSSGMGRLKHQHVACPQATSHRFGLLPRGQRCGSIGFIVALQFLDACGVPRARATSRLVK